MSKIFETLFCKVQCLQIKIFQKYQRGFRKGFSAPYFLEVTLEKQKGAVEDKKVFGALLIDLSKTFDCLSRELIIAKINAYGFSLPPLKLIDDYLSNRQQRTMINHNFSTQEEVLLRIPQGFLLGPILFNIFSSDLFLVMKETEFNCQADNNTLYDAANTIEDATSSLQESSKKRFSWFSENQMQGNPGKCHFILSTN